MLEYTNKPFVGFRGWRMAVDGGSLHSASASTYWDKGRLIAQAQPGIEDSVGIHAYKGPKQLYTYYSNLDIFGTVLLYGRVIVHEFGYRAEKAAVHSLFLRGRKASQTRIQVLMKYQCPIFEFEKEWLEFVSKEMLKWEW